MNKLFTKIVGVALGASMAVGVGVAVANNRDVVSAHAAEGDALKTYDTNSSTFSTGYKRQSGDNFVWYGQKGFYGANNATTHGKIKPTASDLPVVKAQNSSATTDTTGLYYLYSAESVANVGAVEIYLSAKSGSSTVNAYIVSSSTAASSGSATWSKVELASTSDKAQGANVATASTYTFTFNATETSAKYYGVVFATSSYWRATNLTFKLLEGATSTPSLSVDASATVKKGESTSLSVTYANMASGLTISASSDDTNVATVTASQTTTGASGSVSFTVTGEGQGSADITFSVTYSSTKYSRTCTVTVTEERRFEKITKVAELNKTREAGGRYIISSSSANTTVMSTTQNNNNRGQTTATIESSVMVVPTPSSIAVLEIVKGTGAYADYYTIYDEENSGFLYAVGTNNYLRTSNPATKTDYYYWSISFASNHANITNKGNGFVIRHNSGSSLFSCYNGTQTAIDLYELDSDIPVSVALSTITASDSTVQVGSVITYSGSYSPSNATESIIITTLDDTYATAGDVSMNNGTFTVSITGVSATVGTTLAFEGEDGHGSASVTLVVTSYTATHDLVTASSSLSNGSRVVIGCTEEGFDLIAEHSTGATNLNSVSTGFASDKSTLASTSEHEFVVWCVDTTNGYYVFSDGGYYLAAPNTANNYLQRSDVLDEHCYFTLTDSASGVTVTSNLHDTYSIQLNGSTSKFSLYATSQKAASLYASKASIDPIQGFIDVFMHMETYTTNSNYCKDDSHHYYTDAKAGFAQLTSEQREDFCTKAVYASAYARLSSWADNNGDKIDASYALVQKSNEVLFGLKASENGSIVSIIIIASMVSLTAIGGYFFIRRRKKQY